MYREQLPPPALARHVACLWVRISREHEVHAVVPDACGDIISVGGGPPVVVGPATATVDVEIPAGTIIVGARMLPGSVATAFGAPCGELVDRDVPLGDVWRGAGAVAGAMARVHEQVAGSSVAGSSVETRSLFAPLEQALLARLADRPHVDRAAVLAVRWLAANPAAHLDGLAEQLALGHRQLARRVYAATGYAPKLLQRILRFQRAMVALDRPGALAEIAAGAGFLDQAHMTRELRAIGGATPARLRERRLTHDAMSEFFKTADGDGSTLSA